MRYNPKFHHRRSIRLKGYDYARPSWYFVTICTWKRRYFFKMYPVLKKIVEQCWDEMPQRYHGVSIDEFVIMPNHLHGIIVIEEGGASKAQNNAKAEYIAKAGARPACTAMEGAERISLGRIVGEFKSLCVHNWLAEIKRNEIGARGKFWHWNYYERIIRDERELERVRLYIRNNPLKWENDDLEFLGEETVL